MKHKVADLDGALLDAAVAMALGKDFLIADYEHPTRAWCYVDTKPFSPSTDWKIAGPIIERERIAVSKIAFGCRAHTPQWSAHMVEPVFNSTMPNAWEGETPLIAAMRAYVASRLGDEVDLP